MGGAKGVLFFSYAAKKQQLLGGEVLIDLNRGYYFPMQADGTAGKAGAGTANFPLPIPNTPAFVGLKIFAQAFFLDPGAPVGLSFANGLVTTVIK